VNRGHWGVLRRRDRASLLAPLDGAQVVFVVDRFVPQLGMEKAAVALIPALDAQLPVRAVVVAGPPGGIPLDHAVYLGHRLGLLGRVTALGDLRRLGDHPHARIVVVGTWAAGTFALANVGRKVPTILWEHSVLPWRVRHERWVTVAAGVLKVLARRLDRVVSVSEANAASVHDLTGQRVPTVVIPNLSDAPVEQPQVPARAEQGRGSERDRVSILGVGSLIPRKNWGLAISALPLLPEHFELRLAGHGPDRARLSRLAHELGVQDRVTFLGYVENMGALFREADVIAHPSFAETFGYVLIEAAAHHRPVAVLDMPVMTEFVPGLVCGAIAPRPEPEDYAAAVQQALSTDWPYAEADARRQQRMSQDAVVAAWLEVVGSPVGEPRR